MRCTRQQIDREMFYHQVGSNRLMACQTQLPFANKSVTTFTAVRCCAISRAGNRCSISSTSNCRDQRTGRLAARPLQQGSRHCLFHARPFCTVDENLARLQSFQPPVIIYFDLETTSLDPLKTEIIEIGAVSHKCDAAFSSLVQPKGKLDPAASAVTGITFEELVHAPTFVSVFKRFVAFVENLAAPLRGAGAYRNGDGMRYMVRDANLRPDIYLVAHNGMTFDFSVLSSQCFRDGIPLQKLEAYKYCDSLELLRAVNGECKGLPNGVGGLPCLKLQCLGSGLCEDLPNQAHRALDDARKLKSITSQISEKLGISVAELVEQASHSIDSRSSEANLVCLNEQKFQMIEDEDSPLHGVMLITPEAITNYPPGSSEPETDSVNKNTVQPAPSRRCSSPMPSAVTKTHTAAAMTTRPGFDWRRLEIAARKLCPEPVVPTTPVHHTGQRNDASPQKARRMLTRSKIRQHGDKSEDEAVENDPKSKRRCTESKV